MLHLILTLWGHISVVILKIACRGRRHVKELKCRAKIDDETVKRILRVHHRGAADLVRDDQAQGVEDAASLVWARRGVPSKINVVVDLWNVGLAVAILGVADDLDLDQDLACK